MQTIDDHSRVHAVVVTYVPEATPLRELLIALSPQVAHIHVVDNTPLVDERVERLLADPDIGNVGLTRLGDNLGIAKALNVGIVAASAAGATHVLLSDQDSLPASDMVTGLLRAERVLSTRGIPVGAIGPTFTDLHTGITFPFQVNVPGKFFYGHAFASRDYPLIEAITLITSGTLIPARVFVDVGPMRDDFFIDYVDIEWCHRARAIHYRLYGTDWAKMYHRMGDAPVRVWYFGWRRETLYSPQRIYYRARNFTALCKANFIPIRWKLRSAWYLSGVIYTQVVFGRSRLRALRMAIQGIWHGLIERMGQ